MTALPIAAFLHLVASCVPAQPPGVLVSVAQTESGFNPLAVHDNSTAQSYSPVDRDDAAAIVRRLIALGDSVDVGIMQINSANLAWLGLTVEAALDPCESIKAGARVLAEAYHGAPTAPQAEQQAALRRALSAYNTGSQTAGLATYVPAVLASARKVLPELQIDGVPTAPAAPAAPTPSCTADDGWHFSIECQAVIGWHFPKSTTEQSR